MQRKGQSSPTCLGPYGSAAYAGETAIVEELAQHLEMDVGLTYQAETGFVDEIRQRWAEVRDR